jgi:hypothetical protein
MSNKSNSDRGRQMLETSVTGFEYNFISRAGRLYMEPDCCCDMTACIEYFQNIDPDVRSIRTFAGIKTDTAYHLEGKTWVSVHEGQRWPPADHNEKGLWTASTF